ncbi:MAG TPA: M48 family metalloprotease [Micromonospora sp.]|nr:M48 family metalloprotease [Micromonospora sp.]
MPLALLVAVVLAVVSGVVAPFMGVTDLRKQIPPEMLDTPLVGTLVEEFLVRSGGVIGVFVAVALGFVGGFLLVIYLPWRETDSLGSLAASLAGVVAAAIVIGLLYTLYRVLLEPWLLTVSGARQLSRREADILLPILHECARRLDLPNVPRLLIEDRPSVTNAWAYSRHILVTTGLLTDPPEEIAALLSHELVHWRTGDEITSAFVRGVGLPLVLVHAVPAWLMRTFPHTATKFVVFLLFWPVLLTMRYLVIPLQAMDARQAEYRADAGAVIAGHGDAMQALLERRQRFENGRSGWDEAVCATHPAAELRLERLERLQAAVEAGSSQSSEVPAPVTSPQELFGQPQSIDSRRQWLVAGTVLLVLYLLAGVLGLLQYSFFRPQAAVGGYFAALSNHNSEAALGRLTPAERARVAEKKLLADIIKSPDYQSPRKVDARTVTRNDNVAVGEVSFTLAGAKHTSRLTLTRNDTTTLGLFRGWSIENGLGSFTIAGGQGDVLVNGVTVPGTADDQMLVTLPGAYTVTAPSNPLSDVQPATVVVLPDQESSELISLTATVKSTVQSFVDQEIKAHLDKCVTQQVAKPLGCPFQHYYESVESIEWEVVEYPRVEINLITPTRAEISTTGVGSGTVRATGANRGYFAPIPFDEEFDVHITGTVYVVGDKLTLDFNN